MNILKKILFIFLIILSSLETIYSQDQEKIKNIFSQLEKGLNNGVVSEFSQYFSNDTYISLANGITGYYTANQSFYILQDFLSIYVPFKFSFSNISTDSNSPFATGSFKYDYKGVRNTARVFISLKSFGDKWHITQITIK